MIVKAVTFTVEVYLDIDDFANKDIRAKVDIEEPFGFLASQTDAMGKWLHKVADDIATR